MAPIIIQARWGWTGWTFFIGAAIWPAPRLGRQMHVILLYLGIWGLINIINVFDGRRTGLPFILGGFIKNALVPDLGLGVDSSVPERYRTQLFNLHHRSFTGGYH
jgi:hypothetical protein